MNFAELNPRLSERAKYRVETETGRLLRFIMVKEEIANPQYIRGKMTYELKGDEAETIEQQAQAK